MQFGKILLPIWVIIMGVSCSKSNDEDLLRKDDVSINKKSSATHLGYGNDLFFVGNNKNKNTVEPVTVPSVEGHFTSIPAGLDLNKETGSINLEGSEAGQAYKIFYVNKEGFLVDSVRIVISGIDYTDGVYNLSARSLSANPVLLPVYNTSDNLPESIFNSFEVVGANDGNNSARRVNASLNRLNGGINLKAYANGSISGVNRARDSKADVVLQYKLADKSARRSNKLAVQLHYFESTSGIPENLLQLLEQRKAIMERVNKMPSLVEKKTSDGNPPPPPTEEALGDYNMTVRPPVIIVVGG
jgi:hypothetical protein